ncbi:hypothetical protein E1298_17850 [Actinomadura rubrisoli]|uniref:Uncharacterized protein n=1 Tax=Actinomadura rubrisoli TaxID=2530368 RepID=A0A4R5BLD2_9ACTN|nr:hypothetical protein E1298_17850 [Actinomadura rubrisoli]
MPPMYGPPPHRKSSAGLLIGLLAGGVVLVVVIAVVVFAVYMVNTDHKLSTPPSAGGMSRDTVTEARAVKQVETQRGIIQRASEFKISDFVSAVYASGELKYLFVGGTGKFDAKKLRVQFDSSVNTEVQGKLIASTTEVFDKGRDGKAVCTSLMTRPGTTPFAGSTLCAWATRTSFATITPLAATTSLTGTRPEYSFTGVAAQMRKIRGDVED